MFALFFSLYYAMFKGTWTMFTLENISLQLQPRLNKISQLVTNIFNATTNNFAVNMDANDILVVSSVVLALITSIGIVVMAVKGVKKAFGIFFGQIR